MNELRISRITQTLEEIIKTAGEQETTKIIPNCEVVNDSPAGMTDYIIVKNELGYYIPAVKSPGLTFTTGDFVNLLMIKGTEPIAFQHGSGSGTGGYPGSGKVKVTVNDTTEGYLADKIETLSASIIFILDDPGGDESILVDFDPSTIGHDQLQNLATGNDHPQYDVYPCQGRLTLTTGTPVTTADVTAATTLYFTPFKGNRIALYNGVKWLNYAFTELSLSLSGFTADKNSDLFMYDNAGTPTLERTEWTNDTTRATALVLQDGVLVKSGATTRRYLGTFRTTGTTGQCEDSQTKRYIWNYYNRLSRGLSVRETTNHTYNSATWRPWNNVQAAADIEFVIGVVEDRMSLSLYAALNRVSTDGNAFVAIGINTTAGITSLSYIGYGLVGFLNAAVSDESRFVPRVGYSYICVNESSTVGATAVTFLEMHLTVGIKG